MSDPEDVASCLSEVREALQTGLFHFLPSPGDEVAESLAHVLLAEYGRAEQLLAGLRKAEREMAVVVCDCGRPYAGTDPHDVLIQTIAMSINQLRGAADRLAEEGGKAP